MPENKDVAIRKRQQIDSSKKTMFLFVAGAAFVSGVAIVVSFFLVRQILFHGAVVLAKQDTINTLENNKKAAESLKDNVRSLEAVSYTHRRAHGTKANLVSRLQLEKKKCQNSSCTIKKL